MPSANEPDGGSIPGRPAVGTNSRRAADVQVNPAASGLAVVLERALSDIAAYRVLGVGDLTDVVEQLLPQAVVGRVESPEQLLAELAGSVEPAILVPPTGRHADWRRWWQMLGDQAPPAGFILFANDLRRVLPSHLQVIGSPSLVLEWSCEGTRASAGMHLALVLLHPDNETEAALPTRFFSCPSRGVADADTLVADLDRLLSQGGGSTDYGYVISGGVPPGASLTFQEHDPALRARVEELAQFGEGVSVADAFQVMRARVQGPRDVTVERENDAIRVIRPREISLAGEVLPADPDDQPRSGTRPFHPVELRAGDLVLREIERPDMVPKPVEVSAKDLPLGAGPALIVLRPRPHIGRDEMEFYKLFLASPVSREVMKVRCLGGYRSLAAISSAPLPKPDAPLLAALRELRRSRAALARWAAETEAVMEGVFEGSAAKARERLIQAGRQLRQRADAAGQIGSLDHRISTFYPLPVAQQWRAVRAAETTGNHSDTYRSILDCFESTMSYGAALSLAFAHHHEIPVRAMSEVAKKLGDGKGGLGLGDWVNVQKEVSSGRAFKRVEATAPLASVRGLLPEGSATARAQERLSRRRNDEAHQRRIDPSDLPANIEAARKDLELILEHWDFLADMSLLHVKEVDWDALRRTGQVAAQQLRGDHPLCPTVTASCREPGIERGSLYIQDASKELVLLRPFLVRLECPTCRTWCMFRPDRKDQGVVQLKAIDHSHTTEGREQADALAAVGYLA